MRRLTLLEEVAWAVMSRHFLCVVSIIKSSPFTTKRNLYCGMMKNLNGVDPNKDPLQVQWLYEQIVDNSNVLHIEADLFPDGKVYMSGGQLHIKVPKDIPIRPLVKQILDYNGYLAADQILDFLNSRYPQSFFIEIAKGVKPQDLTDEFARMVEHNMEIDKNDREYERLANEKLASSSF